VRFLPLDNNAIKPFARRRREAVLVVPLAATFPARDLPDRRL
jgi:hypothetical protein